MRIIATIVLTLLGAPMVHAQDLSPVLPPTDAARMLVADSVNRSATRSAARRSGPTQRQIAACTQKSQFREEYGADNPKVRRLYSLCRGIGR